MLVTGRHIMVVANAKTLANKPFNKIIYDKTKFCFRSYAYTPQEVAPLKTFGDSNEEI